MLDLFLFCLCCSFAQLAIYISVNHQGMLLHWLGQYLDSFFTETTLVKIGTPDVYKTDVNPIAKPIYRCLVCMASLWTMLFWLAFVRPICWQMLFAVLIVCGMNKILCSLLNKLTDYGC